MQKVRFTLSRCFMWNLIFEYLAEADAVTGDAVGDSEAGACDEMVGAFMLEIYGLAELRLEVAFIFISLSERL